MLRCLMVLAFLFLPLGCSDDDDSNPAEPVAGAVSGSVVVQVSERDEAGAYLGPRAFDELDGVAVYLDRDEAALDSAATDEGSYRFEGLETADHRARASVGSFADTSVTFDGGLVDLVLDPLVLGPKDTLSEMILAPNPFDPGDGPTRVMFTLPDTLAVTLTISSLSGESLATPIEDETLTPGGHSLLWRAEDDEGNDLATGVYYVEVVGRDGSGQIMVHAFDLVAVLR